jgi:hypothetical protein
LLDGTLLIDDIMRVRVKQLVSYRILEVRDAPLRVRAAERAWKGALRLGKPELPRRSQTESPSVSPIAPPH